MAFSVSPRINVREIDLTTVVPAVSTTEGAIAGVFRWGPVEDRTLVSSEDELVVRFGRPSTANFETFFTAANFLSYSNALWVSRAADANTFNAFANTGAVTTTLQIKNSTHFETFAPGVIQPNAMFYAKCPGAMGNSLKVSVCDSAAAFQSEIGRPTLAAAQITFAAAIGATQITVRAGAAPSGTVTDEIVVQELTAVLASIALGDRLLINGQYVKVSAKTAPAILSPGVAQATLTLEGRYTRPVAYSQVLLSTSAQGVTRNWEYFDLVDRAPGTSAFVAGAGGNGDELHVVVVDEGGLFTNVKGGVLEVYEAVSRAIDSRATQGGSNYYRTVINDSSRFVWATNARAGAADALAPFVAESSNLAPFTTRFVGGTDGAGESTVALSAVLTAYDQFKDPEQVDVSLVLSGGGRALEAEAQTITNYLIDNIAESRKDCVVFASPHRSAVVNVADAAERIVEYRAGLRNTSYAVLDSGYKYQYDRYSDVYRWVPLNGDLAGLCARTDELRDPWWSPAGYSRGQIRNVVKLAFNPNQAQRDLIYKAGANPVVTFPGEGTLLYGDKTLLAQPSAFDRINVRRLFIVMEKAIATAAKAMLFEFNDEFTRAQFRNLVEPYLRDIQARRGVTDFRVVADSTNNTGEVIDRNEFVGSIFIKPARSINFITLNFVAVRSAVSFDEVQNAI
ncbi:MAG: hypothetical protein DDT26_00755 [Dehalococcoidia bacterium]|nr:hypothetical protein [Chloroflexota bacterium]